MPDIFGSDVVITLDSYHAVKRITCTASNTHAKFSDFCFEVGQSVLEIAEDDVKVSLY